MSQPIDNYEQAALQSEAMVQDYYKGKPPFCGVPACVPMVPTSEDGTPLIDAEDVPFKYIELELADGVTYLAVLTPWKAANGPGEHYEVV